MTNTLRTITILAAWLLLSGMSHGVLAQEACGDGGGGSKDIQALTATFDANSGDITVAMTLCAAPDNQTKYRVRFDHTAPFAQDADRNGDTLINDADFCVPTSDSGMMRQGNKLNGSGQIAIAGTMLTYTVNMAQLNPALAIGDRILVWADTQTKGIIDRAPDTDTGNGCAEPEAAGEVMTLLLSDAITYAIGDTGPAGGKVFHITDGGLHGLEAAPEDQHAGAHWCPSNVDIAGVDNIEPFGHPDSHSGAHNTPLIAAACGATSAAYVAANYVWPNGQTGGFLPNIEELNLLYFQRAVVGGFANVFYWSSTEVDANDAWAQGFGFAAQSFVNKATPFRVRAVRAF